MLLLNDLEATQRENSAEQLQMRMSERHMVALEFLVHGRLGARPDDIIEEERGDEHRHDQRREKPTNPEKNRVLSIRAHRAPARSSRQSFGWARHTATLVTLSAEAPHEDGRQSETDAEQQV